VKVIAYRMCVLIYVWIFYVNFMCYNVRRRPDVVLQDNEDICYIMYVISMSEHDICNLPACDLVRVSVYMWPWLATVSPYLYFSKCKQ
jgi:hypothetical protein